MFGQQWDEVLKHEDPFLYGNPNTPSGQPMLPSLLPDALAIPGSKFEYSLSGELGYTSSGCSSTTYLGSPATTISSPADLFTIAADHFQQGVQHNQWPNSIIESMNRVTPYSPEEKKERIQRYRSKKNLRNFSKKIKYECRKTLADSRPRVRGRFARNDEIERAPQSRWDIEEDDINDDYNWIAILDALSTNLMP